jgi:hypothetical protein
VGELDELIAIIGALGNFFFGAHRFGEVAVAFVLLLLV